MKKLLACVLCSMILAGCSDPQVTYVQSNLFNVVDSLFVKIQGNAESATAHIKDRSNDHLFKGVLTESDKLGVAHVFTGELVNGDQPVQVSFEITSTSPSSPVNLCFKCTFWSEQPSGAIMLNRVKVES